MSNNLISLKEGIVGACDQVLPMFGLSSKFMCELSESTLNSGEQINILIGLTKGLNGSIVIGFSKEAAFKIISAMMGGTQISELDEISKSALCEFATMLVGSTVGKLKTETAIGVSPPTLVTGEEIFLMISLAPSKKVFFKLDDAKFNIAYCIE